MYWKIAATVTSTRAHEIDKQIENLTQNTLLSPASLTLNRMVAELERGALDQIPSEISKEQLKRPPYPVLGAKFDAKVSDLSG